MATVIVELSIDDLDLIHDSLVHHAKSLVLKANTQLAEGKINPSDYEQMIEQSELKATMASFLKVRRMVLAKHEKQKTE